MSCLGRLFSLHDYQVCYSISNHSVSYLDKRMRGLFLYTVSISPILLSHWLEIPPLLSILCIYLCECIRVCSHEHNLLSLKLLGFCYVQGICRLIWGLLTSVKYRAFPYREMFQVFLSSSIKLSSFSLYLYSYVIGYCIDCILKVFRSQEII